MNEIHINSRRSDLIGSNRLNDAKVMLTRAIDLVQIVVTKPTQTIQVH
jgi:hypothetical protein